MNRQPETRICGVEEFRAEEAEGKKKLVGYAVVFDSRALIWDYFWEEVAPGAFRKTLQENDIISLWNHDSNFPLGRTSRGTLTLREDQRGLWFENILPENSWGADAWESVRRGDVQGNSFRFVPIKEELAKAEDGKDLRRLTEVKLIEISPTPLPAYEMTEVEARTIVESCGIQIPVSKKEIEEPEVKPEPAFHLIEMANRSRLVGLKVKL